MGINRGKDFEAIIRAGFEKTPQVSIDRLYDPMSGFAGVKNICDFIVYSYPWQCYIECKTLYGNTLNFKTAITENQWKGLLNKTTIQGVQAGIIVWFIDYDTTVYVPIMELEKLKNSGAKSLNIKDIRENNVKCLFLHGRKKRVFFEYDMERFLTQLHINALENMTYGKETEY